MTRVKRIDRDALWEALAVEIVEEDAEHVVRQTVEDFFWFYERGTCCRLDDGPVHSILEIKQMMRIRVSQLVNLSVPTRFDQEIQLIFRNELFMD